MTHEKPLEGNRLAILATHGFEQSELEVPLNRLRAAGAQVDVVSPEAGRIRGWKEKDWGSPVQVDMTLDEASAEDYVALVLPGGQINPDLLRADARAVEFVQAFAKKNKPIAAICHGPWLLVEADLVRGRSVTSYPSIRTDVVNAGGNWSDEAVMIDENLITSRKPDDLDEFCDALVNAIVAKHSMALNGGAALQHSAAQ